MEHVSPRGHPQIPRQIKRLENWTYDAEREEWVCAAGHRLTFHGLKKTRFAITQIPARQIRELAACHYRTASYLFQDLSGGHADGTFERRLRFYLGVDLLIVDDFGLRELSVQVAEDFFELVRHREQQGSWLMASNREPADWYGLFAHPVVAEGVLDRLVNSTYHIVLEGKSYRPMHRPSQPATE